MLALRLDTGLSGSDPARFAGAVSPIAIEELVQESLLRRDNATGAASLSAEGFLVYDSVVSRLADDRKVSA